MAKNFFEQMRRFLGLEHSEPSSYSLPDYWKTPPEPSEVDTPDGAGNLGAGANSDAKRSYGGSHGLSHGDSYESSHGHSHGHSHSHGPLNLNPVVARRARLTLTAIIVPMLLATLIGMFVLWPTGQTGVATQAQISKGVKQGRVVVVDEPLEKCQLSQAAGGGTAIGINPQANGSSEFESQSNGNLGQPGTKGAAQGLNSDLLDSAVCARVTRGVGVGKIVPVHIPPEFMPAVKVGTEIKVLYDGSALQSGTPYVFWDIARGKSLGLLAAAYVLLVIGVAGTRGMRALCGLLGSTLVLVFYVLPALMIGQPPILVTITGAGAMMFLSVYFAHGVTIRTTTALIGTFLGLGLTVVLASWGTSASGLSGATSDDAQMLITYFPDLHLPSLFTCGVVIAGLGALNDVTITQASAVWELDEANPDMSAWRLFGRAMRIGRDHIASTVYTLAFAYAGTALPTLILAIMVDRTTVELLTVADIAEEVVRTLVASIGLIISIPVTTAVGTFLVKIAQNRHEESHKVDGRQTREVGREETQAPALGDSSSTDSRSDLAKKA